MNKQIEEMKKIVCKACDFICDCEYLMKDEKAYTWCDLPKEVCEALYNAGYRKAEDIVEKVTVERPVMCDLLNKELQSLMCGGKVCFTADELFEQTNDFFKQLERTRKETAREILQELKAKIWQCKGCYMPDCFESPTNDFAFAEDEVKKVFDEFAEKHGVEVE